MININIIIAGALALLTVIITYSSWYVVRGRHRKERAARNTSEAKPQPKEEKEKQKLPKDSYCYPAINDVMGFEFISVVDVPGELLQLEPEKPADWSESKGIGLQGVAGTTQQDDDDEDSPHLPDEQLGKAVPRRNNLPQDDKQESQQNAETETTQEEEKDYDVVPNGTISEYEIEALETLKSWTNRDYDDEIPEDNMDIILDNNKDMIEESEPDEETLRMNREQTALENAMRMQEALDNDNGYTNMAEEILRDTGFEELGDDSDEDENQSGPIDENDIPAI